MRRLWSSLAPALAGVGVAAALQYGLLSGFPEFVRLPLAFAVLVLVPGAGWLRAIGTLPPGGAWLAPGWWLGLGVAWLAVGILLTRLASLPFTSLLAGAAVWSALPWLAALLWAPRERRDAPRLSGLAALAVAVAALLAAVHVAHTGPPLSVLSDSPDHIGTIRRMLASGDAFPTDAFFRDAGPAGADPRKGLWHPAVALVCALSGADPMAAWSVLAALLAPLFVLNAAGFAFLLGGPLAAAAGGWALLLTYGGGLGTLYLSEAVFATKLADQLALATAAALIRDLETRDVRSRAAVLGLALGTIATHVFGAIQFAITFGALGAGLLWRERGGSRQLGRLVVTSLLCALVAAPYLVFRAGQAYAPVNVIHTASQGMLDLAPGIRIVSFGALWDWLGPLWVLFPLSLPWWARAAATPAALYLFTTTLAVGALMFLPPVVALLEPRLGYLLMRFPWLLPSSAAVAFLVVHARDAWRAQRRAAAAAAAALLVVALAGPVGDGVHAFSPAAPSSPEHRAAGIARWASALEWMDRGLPEGTVVLSDPATSYSVPMLTRHWVTTLVDQHSSPNDSLALERILDARDALDPYAPWARTAQVVRRWGATAIVLNGRFEEPPPLDYWAPSAPWYAAAKARLERAPLAFERVYDQDDFSVYVVHRDALDSLAGGAVPRPFVRARKPDDRPRDMGAGLPELVSFDWPATEAARGDTLHGLLEWRAASPLPAGSYRVGLRFDRALPADVPRAPQALSKLWRKLVERWRGERYRFRQDHIPVAGAYGADRWQPGEVVRDSFEVVVPLDVAAGDYTVKVAVTRQAHYPNMRLIDVTSDDDFLDGLEVGRLQVRRDGGR